MLGLSGAAVLADQLDQYHQSFDVTAMIILLAACSYMWRQHRKSGSPPHSFGLQVAVTFAIYGLMMFVMKEVGALTFFSTSGHPAAHDSHGN